MFLAFLLLVGSFTTVFAEEKEQPTSIITVAVESNVDTAEITIEGEHYLPEPNVIIGRGEFVLDFAGAEPGDKYYYTISQTGGVDETYYVDERVYKLTVSIFINEENDTIYAYPIIENETGNKVEKCQFINTLELINAKVTIVKKSANTLIPLAGAKIAIFDNHDNIITDKNGNQAVGVSNEYGQIVFELILRNDTNYYAKEIEAPAGYDINDEKFYLTRDEDGYISATIELEIIDEVTVIPGPTPAPTNPPSPQTGDESNMTLWIIVGGMALLSIVGLGCLLISKKSKKEEK